MTTTAAHALAVEELKHFELLDGLPEDVVQWVLDHTELLELDAGERFVEEGGEANEMFILVDGAAEFRYSLGGQLQTSGVWEPGAVTGLLPFSRMTTYTGYAIALEPSRILRLGKEHFAEMVYRSMDLGQRLVALMSDRVRTSTRNVQQREKMMALGKLSAGLAHELNNPAAAVGRAADALRERLGALPKLAARVASLGVTHEQLCTVDAFRERTQAYAGSAALSAFERSEREDAAADWLDDRDVPEAWMLAETFIDAGLTVEDLDEIAACVPDEALPPVLHWLEGGLAADRLLYEIEAAAGRISELVGSVKAYSHMDSNPNKQLVDVRSGIQSTLTMLGHKLKRKAITVEQAYDDAIPDIMAYPGELNQVWTNLIDNAIDAMDEGGTLRIDIVARHQVVSVCIIDDGGGIPDDLQSRIFEPFFTTKEVGEGTGLGLDVVQRIIRRNHGGEVNLESRPGRTAFEILLPLTETQPRA